MSDITTIASELEVISKTYNDKCAELYDTYIDFIKNNISEFTFSDKGHQTFYTEIMTSPYLNSVHKAFLFNLLIYFTSNSDHFTLSRLLKTYVNYTNDIIKKEEDPKLSLRPVFDNIFQRLQNLSYNSPNYEFNLLFSYTDGIAVEDIKALVDRYSIAYNGAILAVSAPPVFHFLNGNIYLNQNLILTSNIYNLVRDEFKSNNKTSIKYKTRDRKFEFTFFRNSLDVEVLKIEDGSQSIHKFTLDHVKNCKFENMGDALENIEKVKESISMGFDSKHRLPVIYTSYSLFLGNVYKDVAGISDSVKESAEQLKGYMNITTNSD